MWRAGGELQPAERRLLGAAGTGAKAATGARSLAAATQRAKVLANIAASRAARQASKFGAYVAAERRAAAAAATARAAVAATGAGASGGLNSIPIMARSAVTAGLQAAGYSGRSVKWAYSIHGHHFYPKWLGGQPSGPILRVRGFEHLTDLEPGIYAFVQARVPAIGSRKASQVRALIRRGRVTQDQITDALFDYYKLRYPQLGDDVIRTTLEGGL